MAVAAMAAHLLNQGLTLLCGQNVAGRDQSRGDGLRCLVHQRGSLSPQILDGSRIQGGRRESVAHRLVQLSVLLVDGFQVSRAISGRMPLDRKSVV